MYQSFSPFGQVQGMGALLQGQLFLAPQQVFFPTPKAAAYCAPVSSPIPVASSTFVFEQTVASAIWTIDYPFTSQFPSVSVTDTSGNVVLADVQYIVGSDQVIITFAQPFAGVAYLNV